MRWGWMLALIVGAGCSGAPVAETVVFEWSDGAGFRAEVELPAELPQSDFIVTFRSTNDAPLESTYEYVPAGHMDCYWDRSLPTICRATDRVEAPMPIEISGGGYVRAERMADGSVRYLVYWNETGSADFADFREGTLMRFGILNQQDGTVHHSYIRVSQ